MTPVDPKAKEAEPVEEKPRECGSCKLCCKLPAIEELSKPPGKWCKYADPRASAGCTVFDGPERAGICHEFQCLWLQGQVPEYARPDRIKGYFAVHRTTARLAEFHAPDAGIMGFFKDAGSLTKDAQRLIEVFRKAGFAVVVIEHGKRRQVLGAYRVDGTIL